MTFNDKILRKKSLRSTDSMVKDCAYWLHKIETLRIDRARGDPAPHKPLLLLVILDMADNGDVRNPEIALSADLAFRFSVFWSVVAQRRKQPPEVRLPFHHIGSSGMWVPLMANGELSPNRMLTTKIRLNTSFFNCLIDPQFREQARRVLIRTESYFRPEERITLYGMLNITAKAAEFQEEPREYKSRVQIGRNARFRIEVVVLGYRHTCGLTGYLMITIGMESIVDAAHIHEFKDSRNNDPQNGIALTKNAHWQFDRGLWSLDDNYRVIVNKEKFKEEGLPGQRLVDLEGRRFFLPIDPKYWPRHDYISWHRKQHGFLGN
jgi:putative restriction endonuclease